MRVAARCLQQRFSSRSTTACPIWWQQGWSRQRAGSVAEAELLAPLAELLMPNTPILELFRSFPSPPGWAENYLEPDLAAHGVLKDQEAALFMKYDGYWRHGEKAGIEMDKLKNAALLAYAPAGSKVIRISHTPCKPLELESDDTVLWICVDTWCEGNSKKLLGAFNHVLAQVLDTLSEALDEKTLRQLQVQKGNTTIRASNCTRGVAEAAAIARGGNSLEEIAMFLDDEGYSRKNVNLMLKSSLSRGQHIETKLKPKLHWLRHIGLSHHQVAKVVAAVPAILRLSIQQNLKPTVDWLLGLGLSKTQVAKVVAIKPQTLGYSIEKNLKPTVQWLLDLGLSKMQVVKAVAAHPAVLGYSIERNLKPTVQWMLDLGLSKTQVVKAVVTSPSTLGCSVEQNLKPTVQWLLDLGLSQAQVAKVVATSPQTLGLSIEQNLKPTVQWLLDLGLSQAQVAKAVATSPQTLGLSIEQNLKPTVQWLLDLGLSKTQVAKAMAAQPAILGYSIERNLKPKAQWLLDLGLSKTQVAKVVAARPHILGYSIEQNLKLKVRWLLDLGLSNSEVAVVVASFSSFLGLSIDKSLKPKYSLLLVVFGPTEAGQLVAKCPRILSYSQQRLTERLSVLAELNKTEKLTSALCLTTPAFEKRFSR